MAQKKISPARRVDIGTLSDYSINTVTLPLALDPVTYPDMKLATVKAWFQFLSIVQETTPEDKNTGIVLYTLPALEFAKRMNMSQPRGEAVRNALRPLTGIKYSFIDGNINDIENANVLDTNLLMRVRYLGKEKGKPIELYVDPEVNSSIYETKKAINFCYDDAARLNSLNTIHIFTTLIRLRNQGIAQLPLEDFKAAIGMPGGYPRFTDFKDRVLLPALNDICENTSFKTFRFLYDGELVPPKGRNKTVKNIGFLFDAPKKITEGIPCFAGFLKSEDIKRISVLGIHAQEVIFELCKNEYNVSGYLNLILKAIRDTSETDFCLCCRHMLIEIAGTGKTLKSDLGKILTSKLKKLKKDRPTKTAPRIDVKGMDYADQQKWLKIFQEKAKTAAKSMSFDKRQEIVEQNLVEIKMSASNVATFDKRDITGLKLDGRKAAVKAFISFLAAEYYHGRRKPEEDMAVFSTSLF